MQTLCVPAEKSVSRASLRGLDWLNFLLADVQTGIGPFLAIYLASTRHWDAERVGIVLSAGVFAGVVAQLPAGAVVDAAHHKRALVGLGILSLVLAALLFMFRTDFASIVAAQVLLGVVGAVFVPALNAISLGLVGPQALDARIGRNQAFNSAGNVFAALTMGAIGYLISSRAIFFATAILTAPTLVALGMIRSNEIDYELARAAHTHDDRVHAIDLGDLFRHRRLVAFLVAIFLFHLANAAMLPQLGELLSTGRGRSSSLFMGACVIVTQFVIATIAVWVSRRSSSWGRKPLLLLGFGVLPVRGVLYTLTSSVPLLVGIQVLDGVANAVFLVTGVLVIADLASGTGRFNFMLGAFATAQGLGASVSTIFGGAVVRHYGYNASFLWLAIVALLAWLVILVAVPETGIYGHALVGDRAVSA